MTETSCLPHLQLTFALLKVQGLCSFLILLCVRLFQKMTFLKADKQTQSQFTNRRLAPAAICWRNFLAISFVGAEAAFNLSVRNERQTQIHNLLKY